MSVPKGGDVETQMQEPCPGGDVPREGSRDIHQRGRIISVAYDWCKSTDSPVAYRIWAWQSSASNLANTVRQTDCRSHVMGSIVNECYGDEPGQGGGVESGTYLAECTPMTASPTVRAEGKPMVRYLDKWWMNHKNTWGCLNNSEDLGKYDAPKVQKIDAKLSPIASKEEDLQALSDGTKVAQAAQVAPSVPMPIAPAVPSIPEAPIGPAGGLAAGGAAAAGLGIAVGGGLKAQQRLTEGMNPVTPGNTVPTYTGSLNLSTPAPVQPVTTPPTPPAVPMPPVPPTVQGVQQPTTTPPLTPGESQPASSPPSTPAEQLPNSTPATKPYSDNGPVISESKRADGFGAWVRVTLRKNPCAHLSKGNPNGEGPYRGGSYDGTKGGGEDYESNHTPPWAGGGSDTGLSEGASPSGMMDKEDHRDLLSTGSSQKSQDYRAASRDLGLQGNYRSAVAQEYLRMRDAARASGNGRKYNEMMKEMSDYRRCMEEHGLLPKK